ncbi:MAG: tetratricopeptide repeat protein [Chitinispirillales bacterium]|nr:tetratricopeptide repeat protein [Chitinispirillales bacterium]
MDINHNKGGLPDGADPLVDGILKVKDFVSKNGTAIAALLVAVVAVVGGGLIYNGVRESNIKKAQEIFGVGMLDYNADRLDDALASFTEAAGSYKQTPMGAMGAFMAGSIYLQQKNVDQAVTWFEAAANGAEGGFVKGQALEGLATAYEEKGDAASAVKYLERALKDKGLSHRRSAIRWKLALLHNKGNASAAGAYCKELIADTLAAQYHQKAENLLASIDAGK